MSTYPGTLDSFTTKEDAVDLYMAAHMNAAQAAIVAVEGELGTDPAGSAADLKTRLAIRIADDGKIKQPQQVVTVAKANGDYTTIQAAIDANDDAASDKPYTVIIYPGEYHEIVELKSYVSLYGLDRSTVHIFSAMEAQDPYRDYVIKMANNTAIANLHAQSTGSDGDESAVNCSNVSSVTIYNCKIEAQLNSVRCSASDLQMLYTHNTNGRMIVTDLSDLTIFACHFETSVQEALQAAYGTTRLYFSTFIGLTNYRRAIMLTNASAVVHAYNCLFEARDHPAAQVTAGTLKAKNCTFLAAADHYAIVITPNADLSLTFCTLLKGGTAAESIHTTGAVNAAIALCALNANIHADITNLVATPNNVIDSDIS